MISRVADEIHMLENGKLEMLYGGRKTLDFTENRFPRE